MRKFFIGTPEKGGEQSIFFSWEICNFESCFSFRWVSIKTQLFVSMYEVNASDAQRDGFTKACL